MAESGITETLMAWKHHIELLPQQSWPTACLYVVATPIGNLADFSLRAYEVLRRCDAIAAEDTRNTRILLNSWGLNTPLLAAHRHNEHTAALELIDKIRAGATIALVSDAGAPAVSDPGAYIVQQVQQAGLRVVPIPGPSAVITALMASGATSDANPGFIFAGFIPSKAKLRHGYLSSWLAADMPVVMFETPHRIAATFKNLALLADNSRLVTVARELSKRFEDITTLQIGQLADWLLADPKRQQGEFVLVLHAGITDSADDGLISAQTQATMRVLLAELSLKDAVRIGVKLTGEARSKLYDWALANNKE